MEHVIKILKAEIRTRQSMIDLYEADPFNQAVSKYTSDESKTVINECKCALLLVNTYKRSDSLIYPRD